VTGILLDTVTVSEFRKLDRIHPVVREWQKQSTLFTSWLSVITPLEIRVGILRVRQRDEPFAEKLQHWLDHTLLPDFNHRILGIDLQTAIQAAEFRELHGLSPNDSFIAATAAVHNLTLATRNTADFESTGIKLVNPWEFGNRKG